MHFHVAYPDGEAKFWISPEIEVAAAVGLSTRQVTDAEEIVRC